VDSDTVIVTCSIWCPEDGAHERYAAEARRAVEAGASVIHIDPRVAVDAADYQAIAAAILEQVDDVVIAVSAQEQLGLLADRVAHLEAVCPDVAELTMGSMNFANYSAHDRSFVSDSVIESSFSTIVELEKAMTSLGIRPEHRCYDSGHVAALDPLLDMEIVDGPLDISLVLGVTGGIRPTVRNLTHLTEQLPAALDGLHSWGVIALGEEAWTLLAAALALGGNIRVGLGDHPDLADRSRARSNGELVDAARSLVEMTGRRPATCAEARARLGIPRRARSVTSPTA
jgi:uncharacterized protein (DUF849 family)